MTLPSDPKNNNADDPLGDVLVVVVVVDVEVRALAVRVLDELLEHPGLGAVAGLGEPPWRSGCRGGVVRCGRERGEK